VGVQNSQFSDLRIKTYGCLKILGEVWVGRACVGADQQELTTRGKKCEQEVEKKNCKEGGLGHPHRAGGRPLFAGQPGRPTASWRPLISQQPMTSD
jgi:hypothetical protein